MQGMPRTNAKDGWPPANHEQTPTRRRAARGILKQKDADRSVIDSYNQPGDVSPAQP